VRPSRRCRRVGHVVLATASFHAVWADEVGRDQPGVQAQAAQLATPVVCARARLNGHHAARRKLHAPGHELIALDRMGYNLPTRTVNPVYLDDILRQVHPYPHNQRSCNLCDGTFPFRLQIDLAARQSWCLDTVIGLGKSLRIRSSRAPTARAVHQALGLRLILRLLSSALCRCHPLSSNVRLRDNHNRSVTLVVAAMGHAGIGSGCIFSARLA